MSIRRKIKKLILTKLNCPLIENFHIRQSMDRQNINYNGSPFPLPFETNVKVMTKLDIILPGAKLKMPVADEICVNGEWYLAANSQQSKDCDNKFRSREIPEPN